MSYLNASTLFYFLCAPFPKFSGSLYSSSLWDQGLRKGKRRSTGFHCIPSWLDFIWDTDMIIVQSFTRAHFRNFSFDFNRSLLRSEASKLLHKTFIASTFVLQTVSSTDDTRK